uniref:DJ-1/PfpI domain-containing protein n=1 Tax=Triticum urartu TaxID=4572 RepID=A0A8R7JV29_TRIUA
MQLLVYAPPARSQVYHARVQRDPMEMHRHTSGYCAGCRRLGGDGGSQPDRCPAEGRRTVASVEDTPRIVTRHYKLNLITDVMLEQAAEMEFDLIVMPGGLPGALKFTRTEKLVGMLKKQAESGRPYGAICASPAYVLEPHGLLKGKKATSFPPMSHLLTDQSACEYRVVVDGNLITSRAPGTAHRVRPGNR